MTIKVRTMNNEKTMLLASEQFLFNRGKTRARINRLAFDKEDEFLMVGSDSDTIHVFACSHQYQAYMNKSSIWETGINLYYSKWHGATRSLLSLTPWNKSNEVRFFTDTGGYLLVDAERQTKRIAEMTEWVKDQLAIKQFKVEIEFGHHGPQAGSKALFFNDFE